MDESKWSKPVDVSYLDRDPGRSVLELMPAMEELPIEFRKERGPYCSMVSTWFFHGLEDVPDAQEGIHQLTALRHIGAILASREPKHEHKIAGAGYLASRWLKLVPERKVDDRKIGFRRD